VLFGAQVRQAGGLLAALGRAEAMGAAVMQVFAQSPRQWRMPADGLERSAAFRTAWAASPTVQAVVCHAPYLLNLAAADPDVYDRSRQCLAANLASATAMGALGLVIHPGSHGGTGLAARLDTLAAALREALDSTPHPCPILLENTAGAGGTIGRSFDELGAIIDRAGGDRRLGVCLDTQHLWAAGVAFRTRREADRVVTDLDRHVGLDRLACLHVNDSKVPLGAGLDRHETLGLGTIGAAPLRALLGHPRLQGLPAVLEVPGLAGHGPAAEDLALARRLHAEGLAARKSRKRRARRQARPVR
jgi:deoxyribonuclease-4